MMKVTRIVAIAVIAASAGVGGLHAQNLRNAQAPAEFPPASYRGAQYVDSNGCVFIRAGIDGNVTWVPRVNRQRRLICGQTPTLSASAAEAARTAPRTSATGNGVEQITVAPPAEPAAPVATAPAAAPAPKPAAPARTVQTSPTPKPAVVPRRVVTTPKPVPAKPATRVVVRRAAPVVAAPTVVTTPQPAPARTASVTPRTPACPGASAVSSRYINSGNIAPVRCGPQAVTRSAASPLEGRVATVAGPVGPQTRVVPRQVYDARAAQGTFPVPKGYRPVWEDDRLNPRRAEQSLSGVAQTRLVWTQTVPRRLIDRSTGRDVTTKVALVYPYTDTATQERDLGTVTLVQRDGQLQKRIVRNKAKARTPTVSTRSAPATAPKAQAAATGRYVQVGTYGQPGNAQAAAQRIIRAGLPARIGKLQRGGKSYQVVLAGPFSTSATLGQGLKTSRAAGFSDAFVRK